MDYKISVIVPVYNGEQFVQQCCDQLVNQTLKDIEIIFVNDGSTDNSGEVIDRCAEKFTNVLVVHQKNQGVSVARNHGISLASGHYIGFVDVDDEIEKDMYECLLECAELNGLDIVSMEPIGKPRHVTIYDNENDLMSLFFQSKIKMSVCNKIFAHNVIGKDLFPVGKRIHEDLYAIYKVLSSVGTHRVGTINVEKYHYVHREGSSSRVNTFTDIYFDAIDIADWIYVDAISRYPLLTKEVEMRKARTYLRISKIYYLRRAPKEYRTQIDKLKEYLKSLRFCQVFEYYIKTDIIRYYLYLYARPLFRIMIKTVDKN